MTNREAGINVVREMMDDQAAARLSSSADSNTFGAPKVFESAEELSLAAAWSSIISRTTLIPASLFVMIESSCKAQVTSRPQDYQYSPGGASNGTSTR